MAIDPKLSIPDFLERVVLGPDMLRDVCQRMRDKGAVFCEAENLGSDIVEVRGWKVSPYGD